MCLDGVSYVDRISQDHLTGLLAWYKQNGLVPKEKRSGGRAVNTRAYSFDDVRRMVAFVTHYAEDQALKCRKSGRLQEGCRQVAALILHEEAGVHSVHCRHRGFGYEYPVNLYH